MQYQHILASLAIALFSAIIALILLLGLTSVTELFIAIIGVLVLAIVGTVWWGFKDKIEEKRTLDFYSPIHAMIVRINNEISLEQVNQERTLGGWVSVKMLRIDYQKVSETFTQHSTKFTDDDLKIWAEIEEEIEGRNGGGFYLDYLRKKWLDDLEVRYNR